MLCYDAPRTLKFPNAEIGYIDKYTQLFGRFADFQKSPNESTTQKAVPNRPVSFVPSKVGEVITLGTMKLRIMEDGSNTGSSTLQGQVKIIHTKL